MDEGKLITDLDKTKVELVIKNEDSDIVPFDIGLFFKYVRAKSFIFFIVLLLGMLVGASCAAYYAFFGSSFTGTASVVYLLKFDGIEEGQNPLGQTYNNREILSPEIITRALDMMEITPERSAGAITVEDIRQNTVIQGVTPSDVMDRILAINQIITKDPSRVTELVEMEYNPVQFVMRLNIPKDWKISESQAKDILTNIVSCYQEWFITNYGDFVYVASINENTNMNDYDYIDQLQICRNRIAEVKSYLSQKDSIKTDFISPTTGLKFVDVISQANLLDTVDVPAIESIIYTFSITKDKEQRLAVYNTQLSNLKSALKANEELVSVMDNAILEYERPETTLLVPGLNGGTGDTAAAYQSTDYSAYDELTRRKIEANNTVVETKRQIDVLTDRIARLNTASITTNQKYTDYVENAIVRLKESIANLAELTNKLGEEYYSTYLYQDCVRLSVTPQFSSSTNYRFIAIIFGSIVFGLVFTCFVIICFLAFFYVNRKQRLAMEKLKAENMKSKMI